MNNLNTSIVEEQNVKALYIRLNKELTDGHDFCNLIINEEKFQFIATLYGGESYSFTFAKTNKPFIPYLAKMFQDCRVDNYMYLNLRDHRLDDFIDLEKTGNAIHHFILNEMVDKEEFDLESIEEDITSFQSSDRMTTHHLRDVWDDLFSVYLSDELLPSWSDLFNEGHYDKLVILEEDRNCKIFCKKVLPIIGDLLAEMS